MDNDAWPIHQTLKSPYNHNTKASACEPHLKPATSPQTIQQIANAMDRIPDPQPSKESQCQQLLSRMPDFPEMEPPKPAENAYADCSGNMSGNSKELNNLLNAGYKPLDKINNKWTETSSGDQKLILE